MGGELGELLEGFNTMASQLEAYNEANIEELTAAQVKQQSLIATMADGAVLLDEEGRIVLANPTSRRLFRWEGRNLEGNEVESELPERLSMELHGPLSSLIIGEKESSDLRCSLGDPPRTLRIVLQAVRDASGESLKGIAMTVQDLSGRWRSTPPRAVSSATSPMSCAHRCSTSRATWKLSMTWGIC